MEALFWNFGEKPNADQTPNAEQPPKIEVSNSFWGVSFDTMRNVILIAYMIGNPSARDNEDERKYLQHFLETTHDFQYVGPFRVNHPKPIPKKLMIPHVHKPDFDYNRIYGDELMKEVSNRFFNTSTPDDRQIVMDFVTIVFDNMFTSVKCAGLSDDELGYIMRHAVFVCIQIGRQSDIPQEMLETCVQVNQNNQLIGFDVRQWMAKKK